MARPKVFLSTRAIRRGNRFAILGASSDIRPFVSKVCRRTLLSEIFGKPGEFRCPVRDTTPQFIAASRSPRNVSPDWSKSPSRGNEIL